MEQNQTRVELATKLLEKKDGVKNAQLIAQTARIRVGDEIRYLTERLMPVVHVAEEMAEVAKAEFKDEKKNFLKALKKELGELRKEFVDVILLIVTTLKLKA